MHLESLFQHGYSFLADCLIYFISDCIINIENIFHVVYNGRNLLEFFWFFSINSELNIPLLIREGYILNLRKDNSLFLFPIDEGISVFIVLDEIICVPRHFIDRGSKFILISEMYRVQYILCSDNLFFMENCIFCVVAFFNSDFIEV